jgi:hypothetical protein
MITAQGSLVMIGLNTDTPQVFFNGAAVPGITEVKVDWEHDEQRVKLRVNGSDDAIYMQLVDAGVTVKKVSK